MVKPAGADRPLFLIIAGPNGSGKSTAYEESLPQFGGRTVWIVNPDRLTARLREVEGEEAEGANLQAVQRIEAWLDSSIAVHKSIGVETVLSTDKYRRLVTVAKSRNFEIGLVYVLLNDPDRNVERVAMRVSKGGHAVPEDKIRDRYRRSLSQMPWFLDEADWASLYDNSGAELKLVGRKEKDVLELDAEAPAVLKRALGLP